MKHNMKRRYDIHYVVVCDILQVMATNYQRNYLCCQYAMNALGPGRPCRSIFCGKTFRALLNMTTGNKDTNKARWKACD